MASSDKKRQLFWTDHVERWQSSGLPQTIYCQQHDLIVHRFGYWKRKIVSTECLASNESASSFVQVQFDPALPQEARLSLHFTDGTRLDGINQSNLFAACRLIEELR